MNPFGGAAPSARRRRRAVQCRKPVVGEVRVSLVNPPWQFYNPAKLPPLGLSYLGAMLRRETEADVTLLDLNADIRHPAKVFERAQSLVEATQPDLLGLTCTTVQAPFVVEFVRRYRKAHPDTFVVLGGVHASCAAAEMLHLCPADAVVHSEGETTLVELVRALEHGGLGPGGLRSRSAASLRDVRGITFRVAAGGGAPPDPITTEPAELIGDLDSLPRPAYDLLPELATYQPLNRRYVFSVMASRGCVHRCSFCSGSAFWRHQRWRSPENVVAEVEWLASDYQASLIRFEDDDFLTKASWAEPILKALARVRLPFSCFARLDSMRENMPHLLAEAGCVEVYHGLETTSPRLLKVLRKGGKSLSAAGPRKDEVRSLISREVAAGLAPTVSAIIGIPTETEAEMRDTADFLLELRAMGAHTQLWLLTAYPDTDIVRAYGDRLVQVDRWARFGQFDVFSEAAREAYGKLISQHKPMVPDLWMFDSEAGVEKTGELFLKMKGRLMGVYDFV